jgi:hypothetical protein
VSEAVGDDRAGKGQDNVPSFSQLAQKLKLIPKPEALNTLDRSPLAVFNNIYMPVIAR